MIEKIVLNQDTIESKVLACANPFITSYPHHSCYMSIIGNDIDYLNAILDAYIQLAFNATNRRLDFSIGVDIVEFMEHLPFLEGKYVDRKVMREYHIKYAEYIKDHIFSGYYVYLLVDYYYISADEACFHKRHRIHDLFVYGFDGVKKVFLVKDFLDGSRYKGFEVTYEEMEQAATNLELERDWLRGIKSYQRKSMIHEEIYFHTTVVIDEILKYINGEKSGYVSLNDIRKRQDYDYFYGIRIYDQIMKECSYRHDHGENMDVRCFHILFEHKNCLLYLCHKLNRDYKLSNAGDVLKQFQSILNISYILRNCSLAYNVSASVKNYKNILKFLAKIRDEEIKAMTLLIQNIRLTTEFQTFINKNTIYIYDANIEFDSNWKLIINKDLWFTEEQNASMQTLFFGTDVQIVMDNHYLDEDVKIWIDGIDVEYTTSSSNQNDNEVICEVGQLIDGIHKLELMNIKGMCSVKKIFCLHSENDQHNFYNNTYCEMVGVDYSTKGNWNNIYGTDGFYLIGGEHRIPKYMTEQSVKFRNAYLLIWDSDSLDERALMNPVTDKRIMAYQENEKEFDINIIIPGQIDREVTLYFVDYERFCTELTVQVFEKSSNQLLNQIKLVELKEGMYITYKARGDIIFKIHKEAGRLALVSGIFFQSKNCMKQIILE